MSSCCPIGGVARLERIPEEPRQELLIALAGPAVTLAIIVAAAPGRGRSGRRRAGAQRPLRGQRPFVVQLLEANVLVLLFNLIPAFPLDGGRVLRALLADRMGLAEPPASPATIGQIFAVGWGCRGSSQATRS